MTKTCKICGRPLRYQKGWRRWLAGPYCTGKDIEECMNIQTAEILKPLFYGDDE